MTLSREAREWIERQCGGRIVEIEQQPRWRLQHFVTVEREHDTLSVLARSARGEEGGGPASGNLLTIGHEARVLEALQDVGLEIPKFYGFSEEHEMILMERVGGSNELVDAPDDATRRRVMNAYYEQLAHLHSLDVEPLLARVPGIEVPRTPEEIAFQGKFGHFEQRAAASRESWVDPEPLLDLGVWWLHANVPKGDRRVAFLQGDTGPGQFMFEGDRITALIDWEMAHIGDPMLDLGVGRMRNLLYPTGSMLEPLRHYEEVSGHPIDWEALRFYTIMSMILTPLTAAEMVQRPSASNPAIVAMFGWYVTLRRGLCDAFAEALGLEIDPPELPDDPAGERPSITGYLAEHLEVNCAPIARDGMEQLQLDTALCVARTLRLEADVGARLTADDLDDMGRVLGRRPGDRSEGLRQLNRLVEDDPERHLAELVWLFGRVERRREFLWKPMMIAQASADFEPLAPIDGEEPRRSARPGRAERGST